MFITKKFLPRRTFLKGAGSAIALPLLDAMVPAATAQENTAAAPVRRFGAAYTPNGMIMSQFTPEKLGQDFEFTRILKPLEPFRDHMVVVSGLNNGPQRTGGHALAQPAFLTGKLHPKQTEGADIEAETTLDQLLADVYCVDTPFRSLEVTAEDFSTQVGSCEIGFSCAYLNTISWRTPTTPQPMEINPQRVFERMFGGIDSSPEQRERRLRNRQSVLDVVMEQANELKGQLGSVDRSRVDDFLGSVREIEERIGQSQNQSGMLENTEAPMGIPDNYSEHVGIMYDLMALAFETDITRVFTFMMARELSNITYPEIGIPEPSHAVSHHQNKPERIEMYARTNQYHAQMVANYLEKLKSIPDGDGTLLDNSLLAWGSGMSEGNIHTFDPLPMALFGGDSGHLKGNRHIDVQSVGPTSNLWLSIAQSAGIEIEKLGDSTGVVDLYV